MMKRFLATRLMFAMVAVVMAASFTIASARAACRTGGRTILGGFDATEGDGRSLTG